MLAAETGAMLSCQMSAEPQEATSDTLDASAIGYL